MGGAQRGLNEDLRVRFIWPLVARRLELGISQYEVAERCDVAQSTISDWETGGMNLTLGSLNRWVEALGYRIVLERVPS